MKTEAIHTARGHTARGLTAGNRGRVVRAAPVALALIAVLLIVLTVPHSSGAFVASVRNTTNTAGVAAAATCESSVLSKNAAVLAYRLNEAQGSTTAIDYSGNNRNGIYSQPMSSTANNLTCPRDPGRAYTSNGSSTVASPAMPQLHTFTIEVWFKTVSAGKIMGYGNAQSGNSTAFDRQLYINSAGQLVFGVYPGQFKTVASPISYVDNKWHLATASLSSAGIVLYVDGAQVAADPSATFADNYQGYWRIGSDTLSGWPGVSSPNPNTGIAGYLRFATVYNRALTPAEVLSNYKAGI